MVNWVQIARVIYTETRSLAERDFIEAERSLGRRPRRASCCRHILPHLLPTILVWGTLGISTTVLLEATLSLPRHRRAAADAVLGQHHLREPDLFQRGALAGVHSRAPRSSLLALAFNLVGDALRDILDPTQQGPPLMPLYLARRLLQSVLILLGVIAGHLRRCSTCCRPIRCARSPGAAPPPETVENIRHQLGLDLPFYEQYWRYLGQPAARRSRPLLHAEDRGRRADLLAAAGDACC